MPSKPRNGRGLLSRAARSLERRVRARAEGAPASPSDSDGAPTADASRSVARRSGHLLDRLDGVASTLQRAADLELRMLERLVPIVDDLGELVRHTLDEARERRGLAPKPRGEHAPVIIDHKPDDAADP